MRPQEINIAIQAHELVLKPTLKAACILDAKFNGFEQLARDVTDGKFNVIADVLHIGAIHNPLGREATEFALSKSLAQFDTIIPQIISFILACCGIDETQINESSGEATADNLTSFKEHHAKLFRIATGWLGWTPQDTWNATPCEIHEAYKGRSELLAAIFGGNADNDVSVGPNNTSFDRAGFDTLRSLM
jgi:hypothetical protein